MALRLEIDEVREGSLMRESKYWVPKSLRDSIQLSPEVPNK